MPAACDGPEKIIPCVTSGLTNLPQADGVILFDAHLGDALATFTYVDPAVINNTLGQRDPTLDMFSSANGYNTTTNGAVYSQPFIQSYLAAQAARNAQVLAQAQALLAAERSSTVNSNATGDDIPFTVIGANAARLWQPDLQLVNCTQQAHIFLSHDGTRPNQVVCSVRPPSGTAATAVTSKAAIAANVHIWLGAHALRGLASSPYNQTLSDLTGVDYSSSATSTVGNIGGFNKPLLMVANGGHYFLRPDEIVYNTARMTDKTYAIEEGSVHAGTECTACEVLLGLPTPTSPTTFGYYGDTLTRTEVYMTQWIYQRWGN